MRRRRRLMAIVALTTSGRTGSDFRFRDRLGVQLGRLTSSFLRFRFRFLCLIFTSSVRVYNIYLVSSSPDPSLLRFLAFIRPSPRLLLLFPPPPPPLRSRSFHPLYPNSIVSYRIVIVESRTQTRLPHDDFRNVEVKMTTCTVRLTLPRQRVISLRVQFRRKSTDQRES
jgi:hypothetical protein